VAKKCRPKAIRSRKRKSFNNNKPASPSVRTPGLPPAVPQTPELTDLDAERAMSLLKARYPDVGGLQCIFLGECCQGVSLPKFKPAEVDQRFVQLINAGDHWVVVTNRFGELNEVYLYTSMYGPISKSTILQTTSFMRGYPYSAADNDNVTFVVREFQQQTVKTRLCGFHAVAASFAICADIDPSGIFWDENQLAGTVRDQLNNGSVDVIYGDCAFDPRNHRRPQIRKKLHCICQQPIGKAEMIAWDQCRNWYHASVPKVVVVYFEGHETRKSTLYVFCHVRHGE
jgi:hypothetical protein